MENIVLINPDRVFSLEDAQDLLPLIYRITEESHQALKKLIHQRDTLQRFSTSCTVDLEEKIRGEIEKWELKVKKLGAHPKGVWLADFDNGEGYFCWKFPETQIRFCHGYNEGYTGRRPVRDEILPLN